MKCEKKNNLLSLSSLILVYQQAMNFFAGLLLLLMPEENAFWQVWKPFFGNLFHLLHFYVALHAQLQSLLSSVVLVGSIGHLHDCSDGYICRSLVGIMDDYFDGYYSEDLVECQVVIFSYPFLRFVCGHFVSSVLYFFRWTNKFLRSWCVKSFRNWVCLLLIVLS